MTRHAAFLRGVNLGKRTVKSAELKAAFEALGFTDVKTLLASGNVLFDAKAGKGLKQKIEAGLKAAFGFDVPIVLRTLDELKALVAADPFGRTAGEDAQLHVVLLDTDLPQGFKFANIAGDYDVASIRPQELCFIVYRKDDGTYLGRSALNVDKPIPKGVVATMRNWNTILKAIA
ncbi:MAG: DUF1697 domain-containing protein [Devosia sp.]|uniref:DUF1697 domain-containing protein n=1 Tax=Devosia sp. 66-22 TaxID=1895753 RepID=UPI0009265E88|nr:DUF1697 domain-containing protein [Devosia sp. 66-22]MBN9347821.1 DUF1697 domain-containing protein [Devosia sp.]OJX48034.1 MAG: hypothetical protein BGO81_06295 [Devosia sp. 66-22]